MSDKSMREPPQGVGRLTAPKARTKLRHDPGSARQSLSPAGLHDPAGIYPPEGEEKHKGAVRVQSYEVLHVRAIGHGGQTSGPGDIFQTWRAIARECQEIVNGCWRYWLWWHTSQGTPEKIREYLAKPKEERGGPLKIRCVPTKKDDGFTLRQAVVKIHPGVNGGTIDNLVPDTSTRIAKLPGTGGLPGWWQVLLDQGRPAFTNHPPPIPLRQSQYQIRKVEGTKEDWEVTLKLESGQAKERTDYVVTLRTRGKKKSGPRAILEAIADGRFRALDRTGLLYRENRGKWFVMVCYRLPNSATKAPGDKTAYLFPGKNQSWVLRVGDRRITAWRGLADLIATKRRQVKQGRWSRQTNYRFAGSANKGHGRERALLPIEKFSQAWKDFVKTANYTVAKEIVHWCVKLGVGAVVYVQPDGGWKDRLMIARAGAKRSTQSGWDWYQIGRRLQELGTQHHIEVKVVNATGPTTKERPLSLAMLKGLPGHEKVREARKRKLAAARKGGIKHQPMTTKKQALGE